MISIRVFKRALRRHSTQLAVILCLFLPTTTNASDEAWEAFKTGDAIAIMRHAYAPSDSEISVFEPDRCAGERNLSAEGVTQAKKVMATINANGIASLAVFSSSLCRCIDTGKAFNSGEVQFLPEIDTYYNHRERGTSQTLALKQWIIGALKQNDPPTILITHGLNISDLLGQFAEQGDVLLLAVENDELVVLHQITTPL